MSGEEPVDHVPALREACHSKCTESFKEYRACVDRVKAKGEGVCDGQYFDYLKCIDKCAVPQIFKHLK